MFKRKLKITQIKKNQKEEKFDTVLVEKPMNLYLNEKHLVTIICLPTDLKELAIGFLFSIGLIDHLNQINVVKVKNEDKCEVYIDLAEEVSLSSQDMKMKPMGRVIETACGITSPWREIIKKTIGPQKKELGQYKTQISNNLIYNSLKKLQTDTTLFRETGGCHGAALFDYEGNLLSIKEDIGRHNAIDKVLGEHLLKNMEPNFQQIFLTSTGRLTGDSVLKAIRAGVEVMASVSAPIESGIKLAYSYNLTLIGFVRGKRMNIYTHPERVILD